MVHFSCIWCGAVWSASRCARKLILKSALNIQAKLYVKSRVCLFVAAIAQRLLLSSNTAYRPRKARRTRKNTACLSSEVFHAITICSFDSFVTFVDHAVASCNRAGASSVTSALFSARLRHYHDSQHGLATDQTHRRNADHHE